MSNLTSDRFGSFFDRVQTERATLKIVNLKFNDQQLHGLTESAISAWTAGASNTNSADLERIGVVAEILRRLSARIDALADQSRTVFSGERFRALPSAELLRELNDACCGLDVPTKQS